MLDTLAIRTQRTTASRIAERDATPLEFGKVFSDHMLVVDYRAGEWQEAQILPFGDLPVSPANSALHYGQAIFEGMKAYPTAGGGVALFRPLDNWARLNASAERMCMPPVPEELFMQGLKELVRLDAPWLPRVPGGALYIRPFMFATDGMLGVRPSESYRFAIITCPVDVYYTKPLRVRFEQQYVRSAEGGAGFAKNAGNYGAAMYPTRLAQQEGYHQLIWTDASEHQYVEESGTMNIVFVIDGKLITPALSTSILDGITRRSVLQLAREMGVAVEERRVSSREVIGALEAGTLQEAFGVGTAATIAPIATIGHEGRDYELPASAPEALSQRLGAALGAIRAGQAPDPHGWMVPVGE
ncbi:branched-chain amino acid aminotransferase [Hymenobacter caeli]|uniref:branched-chain-amino-acid transaminase n=1 Tax=Hymenobacter caeli TaxID=2735894 RepID=A0ABX2FRN5_9BACT|nr:branched-chain amino acid aminotransferase [Hymenobacter caeli]NRT19039.1 branched-chain amino acid aminotransferase [Hymenobacter caeli]